MCQYSCEGHDGMPDDWHLVHLGQFAAGGAGLVMAEATAVSPIGRITSEDTGIWNDEQRDAWARIVGFIHSQGAAAGLQLGHAGRKGSDFRQWDPREGSSKPIAEGGWQTVAPSAVAYGGFDTPRALDLDGIDEVVSDFVAAAVRAVQAGFDIVEIHAAHGYLLHEFLSPLSNLRTDDYGGSLENRARLLLRVVSGVREAIGPDLGLFIRFSGTDWVADGWDEEDTAAVAAMALELGADSFDISSGGVVNGVDIPVGEGYQVPLSKHVKSVAGVRTSAVGMITTPRFAEDVVSEGRADAVTIGRQMLRDPHFALNAAAELGVAVPYVPRQYRAVGWPYDSTVA